MTVSEAEVVRLRSLSRQSTEVSRLQLRNAKSRPNALNLFPTLFLPSCIPHKPVPNSFGTDWMIEADWERKMAEARVPFDGRAQRVNSRDLPVVCVYCGGRSQGAPICKTIPYLSIVPRDPLSPTPPAEIAVDLPVCQNCRGRGGRGISAEPKRGWVILGGVADEFAQAMAVLLEEEAEEFERSLTQNRPEDKSGGDGFDWSAIK